MIFRDILKFLYNFHNIDNKNFYIDAPNIGSDVLIFMDNYPKVIEKGHYRIPMSNYQFQIYEILRAKERSSGRGTSNKKSKKKAKKSKYSKKFKIVSSDRCNCSY